MSRTKDSFWTLVLHISDVVVVAVLDNYCEIWSREMDAERSVCSVLLGPFRVAGERNFTVTPLLESEEN